MALPRKYWVFNLLHAVTVPTQTSARLVEDVGFEPLLIAPNDACYRYTTSSIWWKGVFIRSASPRYRFKDYVNYASLAAAASVPWYQGWDSDPNRAIISRKF